MTSIVVIQARVTSSRLPAKVLLPIAGVPLVVVAAKRAGNTGRRVIVAISDRASDDILETTLHRYDIPCFRGELNNVLKRFVDALKDFSDDTVVVRLTADNIVPDGKLINELEAEFRDRNLQYISCDWPNGGLPYGVSAEITYLKHLRYAAQNCTSEQDKEHVTPFIRRQFGGSTFTKYRALEKSNFRCTVDNLDDYLRVCRLVNDKIDIVNSSFNQLIDSLADLSSDVTVYSPATKLILGTAQFGSHYGIANIHGKPSDQVANSIVKYAISNGVGGIDTASAYGDSERVLGQCLDAGWSSRVPMITKLDTLIDCPDDASEMLVNSFVDASVYKSLYSLGVRQLDYLLLHRADHKNRWNGVVWHRLLEHKSASRISHLGVSVQTPAELNQILDDEDIELIQLPFNILDGRWVDLVKKILKERKRRKLTIHARSALLQGLLLSTNSSLWNRAHVVDPQTVINWLRDTCKSAKLSDVLELCLRYVSSQPWIDGVVVGSETLEQLDSNLKILSNDPLENNLLKLIDKTRPLLADRTLNPAIWAKTP